MKRSIDYHQYMASRQWRLKRKEVIEECHNICERCGRTPVENIHHLTYENLGHEQRGDLMGLCRACHEYLSAERTDDPALTTIKDMLIAKGLDGRLLPARSGVVPEEWLFWSNASTVLGYHLLMDVRAASDAEHLDGKSSALPRIVIGPGVVGICHWVWCPPG